MPADRWFYASYALHVEERTIQSISAERKNADAVVGSKFITEGPRDADATPTALSSGIKILPHIRNLTRNVILRLGKYLWPRGDILSTNRSDIAIYHVQFQDLGRTQNVVFSGNQLTGARITVEDGSKTENLFEENFVANIRGNVNPRESEPTRQMARHPVWRRSVSGLRDLTTGTSIRYFSLS